MLSMSTLEILPNEILLECLKYLNGPDLFDGFDQLNSRFSKLLEMIPLYFNFENVSNSAVKKLFMKIKKNSWIKHKAHSLHLSDGKTLQHAELFFLHFSLNEFPRLKSLVLSQLNDYHMYYAVYDIKEILQSLPDLCRFTLTVNSRDNSNFKIPEDVSLSRIKHLSIPELCENYRMFNEQWFTTSLTLLLASRKQIMKIFRCATELRSLTVNYIHSNDEKSDKSSDESSNELNDENLNESLDFHGFFIIHLKQLRISISEEQSEWLEDLLQHTANLKNFVLTAYYVSYWFDADRWENLIRSSLIHLTDFQFHFDLSHSWDATSVYSRFERFQGDFWTKEHQWLVRCADFSSSFIIHTVPYLINEYKLRPGTDRYSSELIDPKSVFDPVHDLTVPYAVMETPCLQYFSRVNIIRFPNYYYDSVHKRQYVLDDNHIESLKSMICLSTVTDLLFDPNYFFKSPSVMVHLLNNTPNISSLKIDIRAFRSVCTDAQVCLALKPTIKSLVLFNDGCDVLFSAQYSFERFYQTFADIEELQCDLDDPKEFVPLIQSLQKLSKITVRFTASYNSSSFDDKWFRQYLPTVDRDLHCTDTHVTAGPSPGIRRIVVSFHRVFRSVDNK